MTDDSHVLVPLMAVLIQEKIDASYSFVIHSKDPVFHSDQTAIEVAVGLGETLASGN
jgi:hypothetical protein